MYVVLAGGVGGARFVRGLAELLAPEEVTVIVNTADDRDFFGLRVCPDLDTNLYGLADLVDWAQGWGIRGDTFENMGMMSTYGEDTWFRLGDRDLATHVLRTQRLRSGRSLSEVTAELSGALGVRHQVLPMTDDEVATRVETPEGALDFQDYLVHRRAQPRVLRIWYEGVEAARPAPGVVEALQHARAIFVSPSNPFVSISTILSVQGVRTAIERSGVPVVGTSPIIGGRAVKGPLGGMLRDLGYEVSACGVVQAYHGILHGFVLDSTDHALAPRLEARGLQVASTGTDLLDPVQRRGVAQLCLQLASRLGAR